MLKILQARLQQYMNGELPDVQSGFRKSRGTRDQIANILWIIKKAREFQKNIYFCFLDYAKAFDCVDHNKLLKILQELEYQTTWPASWEICMQIKKQQNFLTWNNRQVPNWERSMPVLYNITCLFNLYAEYICQMLGWMKNKLESKFLGEISITSYMQMTPPLWQKAKKN